MSVTVWTMPSAQVPISLPVAHKDGTSVDISGDCLTVFAAPGQPIAVWGSGAWQRAEISY